MMGHGMWGGYGGMGLVGPILSLVISVAVIIGIVWLVIWIVRRLSSDQITTMGQSGPENNTSPLDIIKVRYARGEITRDDYQAMMKELK